MLTPEVPKVQPHDHEAEQAILGAILIEPTALARAQELLEPADLYDSRHQRIFRAMGELAGKSEPLDLVTPRQHPRIQRRLGRGWRAKRPSRNSRSCRVRLEHHPTLPDCRRSC